MKVLDVLIPTYNRGPALRRTLERIAADLRSSGLVGHVDVIVGVNGSRDDTREQLEGFRQANPDILIDALWHTSNLGYEANVVALIAHSDAKWVMLLSDDDEVPPGYLAYAVTIAAQDEAGVLIPDYVAEWQSVVHRGRSGFRIGRRQPGRLAAMSGAVMSTQMSGLAFRRHEELTTYLREPNQRNLYLQMSLIGLAALQSPLHFSPDYCFKVNVAEQKNWSYQRLGMLDECMKNWAVVFPDSTLWRTMAELYLVWKQPWRLIAALRGDRGMKGTLTDLWTCDGISVAGRWVLTGGLPFLVLKATATSKVRRWRARRSP